MVTIKKLIIKDRYRYIWLKYVKDVDLSQHCAKCLIGTYESRVNANTYEYTDLVLEESPYYYLCTVWQYATNIHLAFREKEGSKIIIDNDYYYAEIINAERIVFDKSRIDVTLPQANRSTYNTCRNWWFANWIYDEVRNGRKTE